ncbi:hypothetical protein FACS1894124_1580 [Spirochaetia bacterium]|nr:hypothetical protein FACS1894124_1580 [Spirochaetia bacterium]
MAEDILDKVMSLFSGDNEELKVFLRQVLKNLAQNKYAKFYKPRTEEVDPSFAYFIHDIYKTVLPLKYFVQDPHQLDKIRQITVEAYLDKASFDIARRLRSEVVSGQMKTANTEEYIRSLEADLNALTDAFNASRITAINQCYSIISAFIKFVSFDYAALLKQFDGNFKAGDPGYLPKFSTVKAATVIKDIDRFRATASPLNTDGDWRIVLGIFKLCNGEELIPLTTWQNFIAGLRDVAASNIMDLMIQMTVKDPIWVARSVKLDETLAESWLEAKRTEIGTFINGIAAGQRDVRVHSLAANIFGTADITRLHYYTLRENELYVRNGLDGFVYAAGLNYLEAFLSDYLDRELRELCDILLITGQWTANAMSREMSEGYNQLKELAPRVEAFDETLSEAGKNGPRLKNALLRVEKDRSQVRYINGITGALNDEALELINTAAQALIMVGKHLKNVYDDYQKPHHELILNWKELVMVSTKAPIAQRVADAYKMINYFIQLMQLFTAL